MAYDRYCFLVLEESLPEGTIAEHRKARRPKPKRSTAAKRQRPADQNVIPTSARSRRSS